MTRTPSADKPASIVKQNTQHGRDLAATLDRLRDTFFAKLARAQADYIDSCKQAIAEFNEASEPVAETNGQAKTENRATD